MTVAGPLERAESWADEQADAAAETPVDAALKVLSLAGDAESAEAPLRQLAAALKGADSLRRATTRSRAIKVLSDNKVGAPAVLVDAALSPADGDGDSGGQQGRAVFLADPEPWPHPVDGAELLADLAATTRRYAAMPDYATVAIALWVVFANALEAFAVAPILALLSAVKRSGKSTTLNLIGRLVPRSLMTSNLTPAALFRAVEAFSPTLLCDEADTWFRDDKHELRGIFNSGHLRESAAVIRCEGDEHEPRLLSTWCPKAIAAIGRLPDTVGDRSVVVSMRRRAPGESVEPLRLDRIGAETEPLKRRAARWAADHIEELRLADPDVPAELHDRAADNWRPMLAIADAAGGEWPQRAREAARQLSSGEPDEQEAGVLLLSDLRDLFQQRDVDRLASAEIVEALHKLEDRPWPEWRHGKPLTLRQLARILAPFGIKPRKIRPSAGGPPCQGYPREHLADAFERYLTPLPGSTPAIHPEHRNKSTRTGTFADSDPEHSTPVVPDRKPRKLNQDGACSGVPDEKGGSGPEGGVGAPETTTPDDTGATEEGEL